MGVRKKKTEGASLHRRPVESGACTPLEYPAMPDRLHTRPPCGGLMRGKSVAFAGFQPPPQHASTHKKCIFFSLSCLYSRFKQAGLQRAAISDLVIGAVKRIVHSPEAAVIGGGHLKCSEG